ncbi:hypothetical protein SAMN05444340_12626 [Citreimonas salinaria]|uniref:Uncharacterized protein n=1 Tax=Citreimonas salinaria TaxID=321339 RepID=A0A1H3NM47_9RHOB|nr:hypothetical protein SAMN05444340_12626 [Citreimonas salinaria]
MTDAAQRKTAGLRRPLTSILPGRGKGLGLSIAAGAAERLGGEITHFSPPGGEVGAIDFFRLRYSLASKAVASRDQRLIVVFARGYARRH